tara:strand:- start:28283 stop:28597 length:315 start_codon:yes stop_codon:yes gene_type:complete
MANLQDIGDQKRKELLALNQGKFGYSDNKNYSESHPNALSDGDSKGKGNPDVALAASGDADVGNDTDINSRKTAFALNQGTTGMGPDTPYTGPNMDTLPYQSNP